MKIIKRGIAPKTFPKKITCPKCKSELEYGIRDIKDNTDPKDHIPDYYIDCPVCKHKMTVKNY